MVTPESVLTKNTNVLPRDIAGEMLLIPIRGELADLQQVYGLDELGREVWERLDGKRSAEDIAADIVEDYDVSREQCRADVLAFLSGLLDAGLVHETAGP